MGLGEGLDLLLPRPLAQTCSGYRSLHSGARIPVGETDCKQGPEGDSGKGKQGDCEDH